MGAESGPTVHSVAADYLKRTYNKPGNVFVGIVSRLDAMTSGVIVLARTSKAASRLVPQFSGNSIGQAKATKTYLAVLDGHLDSDRGILIDEVIKDDTAKRMRVVAVETPMTRRAQLRYVVMAEDDESTLVAVRLDSGRKHQIRLQFAERGHAVLGDRKYGSTRPFSKGIALHSFELEVTHPTRGERMKWRAKPPPSWTALLRRLRLDDDLAQRLAPLNWSFEDKGAEPET